MAMKDYYLILGIPREATERHVQRAFRRLAKEHHPDRVGPESTAQFQEIAEAYEVLSDPRKRRDYDDRLRRRTAARRVTAEPVTAARWRRRVEPLVPEPLFSAPAGFRRRPIEDLSALDREPILDLYRFLLRL